MELRMCPAIAITIGSLAMVVSSVQAIPVSQELRYDIHADPADPQSKIVLTIDVLLTAVATDLNTIGWQVDAVQLAQPKFGVGGTTVWVDLLPSIATLDGLWWVEHADLANPVVAEFALPQLVQGTAVEQNSANPELLDYAFKGDTYIPPPAPSQPPFATTAAMTGVFWVVGQPTPDVVALGESVALIDPIRNDPPGGT